MEQPKDDLAAQILSTGAARFSHGAWTLATGGAEGEDLLRLSKHEELHQVLNDLTTFGLLLDALAILHQTTPSERWERMLTSLVGRCRTTHETFATYNSSQLGIWHENPINAPKDNPEYSNYYRLGATIVSRLPTKPLGMIALSGVVRLAMNGPLPAAAVEGRWDALRLSDFRAADAPDYRFERCLEMLDAVFWQKAYEGAKALFGLHPQWGSILANPQGVFTPEQYFQFTPLGGGLAWVGPGGIDQALETAVANYFIDRAAEVLRGQGIPLYSLAQRKQIEASVRDKLPLPLARPNDQRQPAADFKNLRLQSRERLLLRKAPLQSSVRWLHRIEQDDWRAYIRILKEEGSLPVYLRSVEEVRSNHGLAGDDIPNADGVTCFLRKKRLLADESIGLDLHFVNEPERLARLSLHAALEGGEARICVSGRVLLRADSAGAAAWLGAAHGMPMSVLLDADPQRVIEKLNNAWDALVWHIQTFEAAGEQDILFLFPVGTGPVPDLALFRPGTYASLDATLLLLREPAIPLMIRQIGVNTILGLPEATMQKEWNVPLHCAWTANRYLSEEYLFLPVPSEEDNRD
jgi:hypothetical protein